MEGGIRCSQLQWDGGEDVGNGAGNAAQPTASVQPTVVIRQATSCWVWGVGSPRSSVVRE